MIPPMLVLAAHIATATPTPTPPPVRLEGTASWYSWHPGEAAAGPALRQLLGDWRGHEVRVCAAGRCVMVRLTDWCQCYRGTSHERVIDLSASVFARLEPLSRGLAHVTVTP